MQDFKLALSKKIKVLVFNFLFPFFFPAIDVDGGAKNRTLVVFNFLAAMLELKETGEINFNTLKPNV